MANGRFGPDLTHLMSRDTIAAGAALNTRKISGFGFGNPVLPKPGSLMPAMELNDQESRWVKARYGEHFVGSSDTEHANAERAGIEHAEEIARCPLKPSYDAGRRKSASRLFVDALHEWVTTVDLDKRLGILYIVSCPDFSGDYEIVRRWRCAFSPFVHTMISVPPQVFNRMFTMHGTDHDFLCGNCLWGSGFANYPIPLMIGARDVGLHAECASASGSWRSEGFFCTSAWWERTVYMELETLPDVGVFAGATRRTPAVASLAGTARISGLLGAL